MRLYLKHNLAFQHINRCGGISTCHMLDEVLGEPDEEALGGRHVPLFHKWRLLKHCYGLDINSLDIYANIRSPFARLVSIYHYRKINRIGAVAGLNFEDWFYLRYVRRPRYTDRPIRHYLMLNRAVPTNVTIVRLEDASDVWPKIILERLNIKTTFPHLNKSKHEDPMSYFDANMRKVVMTKERWLLKNFYSG